MLCQKKVIYSVSLSTHVDVHSAPCSVLTLLSVFHELTYNINKFESSNYQPKVSTQTCRPRIWNKYSEILIAIEIHTSSNFNFTCSLVRYQEGNKHSRSFVQTTRNWLKHFQLYQFQLLRTREEVKVPKKVHHRLRMMFFISISTVACCCCRHCY